MSIEHDAAIKALGGAARLDAPGPTSERDELRARLERAERIVALAAAWKRAYAHHDAYESATGEREALFAALP